MSGRLNILVLTKRQYTNKDLIDDRFGRIRELPLELARRGHTVRGLCLSYRERRSGISRDEGVLWESINAGAVFFPGLVRFVCRAVALVREVDVVWACSDSFYGILACVLGRLLGVPVVFDLYDNFEFFLSAKIPLLKQSYHWAIRQSDAVTCVSAPLARLIMPIRRRQGVHVLENAARLDLFKPADKERCRSILGLPTDALLIGTAGALTRTRGFHHLLEAFQELRSEHPTLQLALAGAIDPEMPIPDDPCIHYLGLLKHDTVPVFLNSLDLAVVCNLPNAFGRYCYPQKAREVMACNIPLIAAKVGSMAELLHSHPEWLYDPTDTGSLIGTLRRRLSDRRTDYGLIPDWGKLASILEAIFIEVCSQTKVPAPE